MSLYVKIGRRRDDPVAIYDLHNLRGIVKGVYSAKAEGIALEEIVPGPNDQYKAIALVHRHWGNQIYFLNERKNWEEDDYFKLAERLKWKHGITNS